MATSFWGLGNRAMQSDIIEIETSDDVPDGQDFLRDLYFGDWLGRDAEEGARELDGLVAAAGYRLDRLPEEKWHGCRVVHLRVRKV